MGVTDAHEHLSRIGAVLNTHTRTGTMALEPARLFAMEQ